MNYSVVILILSIIWISLSYFFRVKNPSSMEEAYPKTIPVPIQIIFERSCYDCHSNYTNIPWYGYVFPTNILLNYHIHEGRESFQFSNWDSLEDAKKADYAFDILEQIESNEMPPTMYQMIHWDSIIDTEELLSIRDWYESLEKQKLKGKTYPSYNKEPLKANDK